MGESFVRFFNDHPFLAVFIAVFMILPMIGAVIHIILKALGRKGIDNSPPSRIDFSTPEDQGDSEDTEAHK
ncbi:MAG: hypothetical protein JSU85_00500 [Candidatus Zixiibacteriota bacterium]|nr:MAG: hypothetical protein JSU85_00500 [candidate division Zixibacteria bacterium]